jgi:hypothetical protein
VCFIPFSFSLSTFYLFLSLSLPLARSLSFSLTLFLSRVLCSLSLTPKYRLHSMHLSSYPTHLSLSNPLSPSLSVGCWWIWKKSTQASPYANRACTQDQQLSTQLWLRAENRGISDRRRFELHAAISLTSHPASFITPHLSTLSDALPYHATPSHTGIAIAGGGTGSQAAAEGALDGDLSLIQDKALQRYQAVVGSEGERYVKESAWYYGVLGIPTRGVWCVMRILILQRYYS